MPSPAINQAPTFANIPCFVPSGVLWYTQDLGNLYIGTGVSDNGGTPGVNEIGSGSFPIIEAGAQSSTQTTNPTNLTLVAAASVMYNVSLYMGAAGTAPSPQYVETTLSWTSPLIGADSISATLSLFNGAAVVMETFPIFCVAATSITLGFAYGGTATNAPYSYSARIVQMPI